MGWFGVAMILDFRGFAGDQRRGSMPVERDHGGGGVGGLAADWASASSFDAVIARLAAGPWSGPASVAVAGAAAPPQNWLSAAAGRGGWPPPR